MIKQWSKVYKQVHRVVIADNIYQGPGSQKPVEKKIFIQDILYL